MRKIKIIIVGGYGSSSREPEDNLPNQITNEVGKQKEKITTKIIIIDSGKRRSIKKIKEEIEKTSNDWELHIYLKSYGWCRFKKYFNKYYTELRHFRRVRITIIDGHGRIWFDKNMKPYGKRRNIKFSINEVYNNTVIQGFYQHNKYPHGAKVEGYNCKSKKLGGKINHTTIVNCKAFRDYLRMVYET